VELEPALRVGNGYDIRQDQLAQGVLATTPCLARVDPHVEESNARNYVTVFWTLKEHAFRTCGQEDIEGRLTAEIRREPCSRWRLW